MPKRSHMVMAVLAGLALAAAAHAEPTLESVEKALAEQGAKLKSYSADMKVTATKAIGPMVMTSKGKGTVEKLLVGDVWRFRMDLVNTMTSDSLPGAAGGLEATVLSIFDGKVVFVAADMMGMKQVMKKTPEPKDVVRQGDAPFEKVRQQGALKLLPDETVNAMACYVVEMTPSEEARAAKPELPKRMLMYFAKDSGIPVKTVMYDDAGKSFGSMELANIKLNPELDPSRFTYTPPEGVTVRDMTGMKAGDLGLF